MNGFSITQEALLASEELIQNKIKAEASSPQLYKKFVNLTEQGAVLKREERAEDETPEEGGFEEGGVEGGAPEEQPNPTEGEDQSESPHDTPPEAENNSDAGKPTESDAGEDTEGSDALSDSIDQDAEPAMESLSEWIKDKTQYSDSAVIRNVGALAAGLAHIGITYGPAVLGYMFKGVVWTFSRLGTIIYESAESLSRYIEKSKHSISKLETRLDNAEQTIISQLNEGRGMPRFNYKNQKAIEYMRVGQNTDFSSNIRQFAGSLVKATDSIAAEFEVGVAITEKIAGSDARAKVSHLRSVMEVSVPRGGFTKGSVPGYETNSELVEQYHTNPPWPGTASLVFNRPIVKDDEISHIASAYGKADMYIAMAKNDMGTIAEVPSLNNAEIIVLAKSARILLAAMKEVNKSQERMKALSPKLALKAKQMFYKMADDKAKVSMKDSMVEPLYLRSSLAATVFVAGSTSSMTHASRVAAAAIAFIETHASKIATSTD